MRRRTIFLRWDAVGRFVEREVAFVDLVLAFGVRGPGGKCLRVVRRPESGRRGEDARDWSGET